MKMQTIKNENRKDIENENQNPKTTEIEKKKKL
jgi:hypothetical protein